LPACRHASHEHELFDAGQQAGQRSHGLWALQCQKRPIKLRLDGAAGADAALDVCQIAVLAGPVDDDEDVFAPVHEHQVVDDAALVIEQQTVALLVQAQAHHIHRHQALEGDGGVRAGQSQLTHVRDIKQAGGGAGVVVFGDQSCGVLHRHAVTGKRHHARTEFEVQGIERGGEQVFVGGHGQLSRARFTTAHAVVGPRCPLYLRDSPGTPNADAGVLRFAPSVGAVVRCPDTSLQ